MKPAIVPYIPDTAPFTAEQRAWLNGFLAGMFSDAPRPASAVQPPALRFTLYFATQSGTAERLAKKMAKELKSRGHVAEIFSLAKATPSEVACQKNALFFASTYGEGEPPDDCKAFREALFAEAAPAMAGMRYSVFCLGDRHYEQFCRFGIELDERLQTLGGSRILPRLESDVDVDAPFAQWMQSLGAYLTGSHDPAQVVAKTKNTPVPPVAESTYLHTRENPLHAVLRERKPLTSDVSSKLTVHLSFGLEDSPAAHYQAGDACGVIAQNDPALIDEMMALLPFDGAASVEIPKHGKLAVREALLRHLQPTRLSRKIVQAFAELAGCTILRGLLVPEQGAHLESYIYDRGLIDLLDAYPGVITTPQQLVAILPKLAPRLYSISSSPAAHGREVHCTVALVRYRSHNRERGGVASSMLAERVDVGGRLPIYIQPNKQFRLPGSGDVPMVMIGPGTGIAPFRSFLHERLALGQKGRNWLFFGERSARTDFLYSQELGDMLKSGHLSRLDTAFSRDQAHKIYVQDRMVEHGAELWRWLQEGAQLYVCGDADRMAKDVDAALHAVVERHGGMHGEAAREYVAQLHDDRRYHRDVY